MVVSKIGDLAIPEAGGDRPARYEQDARSVAVVFVVQRNVVAEVEVRRRSGPFLFGEEAQRGLVELVRHLHEGAVARRRG